jgi:adenosine kinase
VLSLKIVITGSVAYDYLMTFPGYFRDHLLPDQLNHISLSFLVDAMTVRRGGVAPNIAYTLALLGGHPRLMAAVGEDFEEYRGWLEGKGVDTSLTKVIPGVFTASFFANTDLSNAQIASFYPGAMAHAKELSFRDWKGDPCAQCDLVMISPNDPEAMNQYVKECGEIGLKYFYDPSQQIVRLDKAAMRAGVEGARALFVNDYEYGLIQKATGFSTKDVLEYVEFLVVTCGESGVLLYTQKDELHIPVVPPLQIVDPTGVGDAFRGGFLAGFSQGWELELCAKIGVLAATYCLEQRGPQTHYYQPAEFVERFRQHFDDQGLLDSLL